jgi:hypothetical protein
VADTSRREREEHQVAGGIFSDPTDDLDRGTRPGRRHGDPGAQAPSVDPMGGRLGDGTADDDDHPWRVSGRHPIALTQMARNVT